jgi:hypothetical protein
MWAIVKKAINSTVGKGMKPLDELMVYESYSSYYRSSAIIFKNQENSLIIPNGVEVIGSHDHSAESGIGTLVLPPSLKEIGTGAFEMTDVEGYLVIPPRCHTIGDDAFQQTLLEVVDIPKSVKKIGEGAFRGVSSLRFINYAGTIAEWRRIELGDDWNQGVVDLTVTCIDGNAYGDI